MPLQKIKVLHINYTETADWNYEGVDEWKCHGWNSEIRPMAQSMTETYFNSPFLYSHTAWKVISDMPEFSASLQTFWYISI